MVLVVVGVGAASRERIEGLGFGDRVQRASTMSPLFAPRSLEGKSACYRTRVCVFISRFEKIRPTLPPFVPIPEMYPRTLRPLQRIGFHPKP